MLLFHALPAGNEGGEVTGPKAVVNVNYRDACRTAVEHGEKRSQAAEAGAITNAGGHGNYWTICQAADDAGQGAFHARDDHNAVGDMDLVGLAEEPVNARNAGVINGLGFVAEHLKGHARFLGDWNVCRSGANHHDLPGLEVGLFFRHGDAAGPLVVLRAGMSSLNRSKGCFIRPRGQEAARALQDGPSNLGDVIRTLSLTKNDLREPATDTAMVVHAGKGEVFVRLNADLPDGIFDRDFLSPNLFQQLAEILLHHG